MNNIKTLFALSVVVLISAAPLSAAIIQSGYDSEAATFGGMRLREFRTSNNGGEVYLGTDLGSASGRVENDWVYDDEWGFGDTQINTFELSFDASTGYIASQVTTASGSPETYNLSYLIAPEASINYIQLSIVARTDLTSITLNDLTINTDEGSQNLGSFTNVTGWNDWSIYGSFNTDFSITGSLILNGQSSNQENNKLQLTLGNSNAQVPEPTTVLLLTAGSAVLFVKKRNV